MSHYVCTGGCGGEAVKQSVCEVEDCSKEGQPLIECSCDDGSHDESSLGPKEEELSD